MLEYYQDYVKWTVFMRKGLKQFWKFSYRLYSEIDLQGIISCEYRDKSHEEIDFYDEGTKSLLNPIFSS